MIHVQNLTKKFDAIVAVDNVSFSVAKGEIFAFLGPNGAGKSTTIKMLTTLLHPSSGTITLDGHDPVHHPDEVRRSFGIVVLGVITAVVLWIRTYLFSKIEA